MQCVAQRLNRRCPNKPNHQVHRHVVLEDGRKKATQIYPNKLCREICGGIQEQIQKDREGQFLLANTITDGNECSKKLMKVADELKETCQTMEEEEDSTEETWDDVSGNALNPKEMKKARKEEIAYVNKMQLYNKAPIKETYEYTGKAPISVRWIDINKSDSDCPNYRSRLVAREINTKKRDDWLAATPPLETLKLILSFTTTSNTSEILIVNDVSRAFSHAPTKRRVYVQLPEEDCREGERGLCGRLHFSMYGTRDAAQNWFAAYSQHLVQIGFE